MSSFNWGSGRGASGADWSANWGSSGGWEGGENSTRARVIGETWGNWKLPTDIPPTDSIGVARQILNSVNIPITSDIQGSKLNGYDIKSQDSLTMLKLSLLAESIGEDADGGFAEIYCNSLGTAQKIIIGGAGETSAIISDGELIYQTLIGNYVNKVDHVLVRAQQTLPTRFWKDALDLMGNGIIGSFNHNCIPIGNPIKQESLNESAWVEFTYSPQSKYIQDLLQGTTYGANKSNFEQIIGYKYKFPVIPPDASFSISQTTPKTYKLTSSIVSTLDIELIGLQLGQAWQDGGGIVDISNVTAVGAEVLDLVEGPPGDFGGTYIALLDDKCTIMNLSRGKNWFILRGNDPYTANIFLVGGSSDSLVWKIHHGIDHDVSYYRRLGVGPDGNKINSISEMTAAGGPGNGTTSSPTGHGTIVVGLNEKGFECTDLEIEYTISKPSIQIRSVTSNAYRIAISIAADGLKQISMVVKEEPPWTGYKGNGSCANCRDISLPPTPPQEDGTPYNVDDPLNELQGSVVDITAPFLGKEAAKSFAARLYGLINNDTGEYTSYSYAGGGYGLLPGMILNGYPINTIEFLYADKDSVSTNITTGPIYQPIGSYSQSLYLKRTETITRSAIVVAGSSSTGEFIVDVEGRGAYEAYNQLLESIYPGDKVDVKLMNVPVEI